MPRPSICPDLSSYQRIASGLLADAEKEILLNHLESCDACAARLNALPEQDALVALIRQGQTLNDGESRDTINRLVERLSKLRPDKPVPLKFTCLGCGKTLRLKAELVGKKVRCPHCKKAVSAEAAKSSAPAAPSDSSSVVDAVVRTTNHASGKREDTMDQQPASAVDKEVYDFLTPPQAPDELGRLGPYRVLQVLGAGGMGVVFRAEDPQLMRLVALKAMLPALAASANARQRFLREARAAAAIKHDHIVTIYQVGEDRGVPFLAMDFLEGEALDARLKRAGKLPVDEVLRIGREIALGLAAAHQRGLIHRDIKPANIWLEGERGRVKILDFGLARGVGDGGLLTVEGAIVGTPAYMAPEQGRCQSVDHRCDLFSLGCVLYHLAVGKRPFRGRDTISLLVEVATENPAAPVSLNSELPSELSDFIMQLLAKPAEERPASAQVVAETLERMAAVGVVSRAGSLTRSVIQAAPLMHFVPLDPPKRQTAPRVPKKWPILAGATACFLLLVLAGLWSAGVFKVKTPDGVIVLENLPADAEVFVDGKKVSVKLAGDGKPIEIEASPGKRTLKISAAGFKMETREVTLASGERQPIGIRLEPLTAAAAPPTQPKNEPLAPDPDRKAAEYVLSIGGVVRVNDEVDDTKAVADLPRAAFRLTQVNLSRNPKVTDAGLANFKDCKNLTILNLYVTSVSDTGLANFKDCKNLTELWLHRTQVTDAGLAYFEDCKKLTRLDLGYTQVNGTGLAHFRDCKKLTYLHLAETQVSDADLAHFKDCKDLTFLDLRGKKVSDLGLAHFKDCKNLTELLLGGNKQVSDAGLAYFKDCKNLTHLYLDGTQMTDKGLAYFKNCKNLTDIGFWDTAVTAAGADDLMKALPRCKLEPSPAQLALAPDRRAAEYVLSIGGTVRVNDEVDDIKAAAELPRQAFRLTYVDLRENQKVRNAGLAAFEGCTHLTYLQLDKTQVKDQGLAYFKDCKNLESLYLWCAPVTEVGLAYFTDCKNLKTLTCESTGVSDLLPLKDMKLTSLCFKGTQIKDLSPLAGMPLTHLDCTNTQVSDLAPLKDMKLTFFSCAGTPVSDLTMLKGMKLTTLYFTSSRVGDLTPLKDMKLTDLGCDHTPITDLTPLQGMMLTSLDFSGCERLQDLAALHGMPLTRLLVGWTRVSDLAPLKGMKLTRLECQNTQVSDLAPLKGMPLRELRFDVQPKRDAEILRSFKTLERINDKPAADFWKEVDANQAKGVSAPVSPQRNAADLAPDRKAAEYVRSIGGAVRVNDEVDDIKAAAELPRQAFRLTYVEASRNPKIRNAGLAVFKGCRNLKVLNLFFNDTPLKDVGAANFKDCKNLTSLPIE